MLILHSSYLILIKTYCYAWNLWIIRLIFSSSFTVDFFLSFQKKSHVSVMHTFCNCDKWVPLNIAIKKKMDYFWNSSMNSEYEYIFSSVKLECNSMEIISHKAFLDKISNHLNDKHEDKLDRQFGIDRAYARILSSFVVNKWFIAGSTFDVVWIDVFLTIIEI